MRTTEQIERAIQALRQFGQSLPDDYTLAELCGDLLIARGIDGEKLPADVTISEELLNDGAALSVFLNGEFEKGYTTVELQVMPSGGKPSETE